MASNSSTTSPPPESSTSQTSPPPPPPSGDNPSPPPPSDSSPPPPPSPSVTPLPPPPPAAEDDQQYSPPPPPAQGDDQQYSPPPPPSPNSNNGSSPYRPPPPPHQSNQFSPPPPPPVHHQLSSPKSSSSNSNTSSSSNSSGDQLGLAGIIGIATGGGLLLLLVILLVFTSSRKKKRMRSQTTTIHYYPSQHGAPADNNNNNVEYFKRHEGGTQNHHQYAAAAAGYNNNNNGEHHVVNILPPPPGNWGLTHHQYPQAQSSTAEMSCSSSCYSGSSSHGPALPPPHPTVALGFNQSSFTFEELSAATAGFAQRNLLGQGGFGYVHKGVLPNGKEIAVKSLKSTGGGGQGDREFQAEVDIISRVHHKHLVSLVGYCMSETQSQKLLVYEFVPNKTLDYHLHGKGPVMDWATRLKIAIGICKGLAYLHEDCHPRIIHRDIKGPNILIENNFEAKVADFGLAKITLDANTHVSTRVMGTFGYLAPEYASTGKLTDKSDVFSYGVMLLELITGRRPVDTTGDLEDESLVDWARPLCVKAMENGIFEGLVDARLEDNYEKHEMSRMVACAAAAVRHSSRRRPKMSHIVRVLEGDASLEILNHEGVKRPGQSSVVLSSSSSSNEYSADMKKLKKLTLDSSSNNMMISSEFGGTSEYGLNLSISSSDLSSTEYGGFRTGGGISRMQTP